MASSGREHYARSLKEPKTASRRELIKMSLKGDIIIIVVLRDSIAVPLTEPLEVSLTGVIAVPPIKVSSWEEVTVHQRGDNLVLLGEALRVAQGEALSIPQGEALEGPQGGALQVPQGGTLMVLQREKGTVPLQRVYIVFLGGVVQVTLLRDVPGLQKGSTPISPRGHQAVLRKVATVVSLREPLPAPLAGKDIGLLKEPPS